MSDKIENMIIIGGGYIPAEFAHFCDAMGTDGAIIQRNNRLVPDEEPEVSETGEDERRIALGRRRGVEDRVWVRIGTLERVYAIADEDMDRANDTKTSAVHFLRFELPTAAIEALRTGAGVAAGVDHAELTVRVDSIPELLRESLIADLA